MVYKMIFLIKLYGLNIALLSVILLYPQQGEAHRHHYNVDFQLNGEKQHYHKIEHRRWLTKQYKLHEERYLKEYSKAFLQDSSPHFHCQSDGQFPDPVSCNTFYICQNGNARRYACINKDDIYSSVSKLCVKQGDKGIFCDRLDCKYEKSVYGLFQRRHKFISYSADPVIYIECDRNKPKRVFKCPQGNYFSEIHQSCLRSCIFGNLLPNTKNCRKYLKCETNFIGKLTGDYRTVECPPGTWFNIKFNQCTTVGLLENCPQARFNSIVQDKEDIRNENSSDEESNESFTSNKPIKNSKESSSEESGSVEDSSSSNENKKMMTNSVHVVKKFTDQQNVSIQNERFNSKFQDKEDNSNEDSSDEESNESFTSNKQAKHSKESSSEESESVEDSSGSNENKKMITNSVHVVKKLNDQQNVSSPNGPYSATKETSSTTTTHFTVYKVDQEQLTSRTSPQPIVTIINEENIKNELIKPSQNSTDNQQFSNMDVLSSAEPSTIGYRSTENAASTPLLYAGKLPNDRMNNEELKNLPTAENSLTAVTSASHTGVNTDKPTTIMTITSAASNKEIDVDDKLSPTVPFTKNTTRVQLVDTIENEPKTTTQSTLAYFTITISSRDISAPGAETANYKNLMSTQVSTSENSLISLTNYPQKGRADIIETFDEITLPNQQTENYNGRNTEEVEKIELTTDHASNSFQTDKNINTWINSSTNSTPSKELNTNSYDNSHKTSNQNIDEIQLNQKNFSTPRTNPSSITDMTLTYEKNTFLGQTENVVNYNASTAERVTASLPRHSSSIRNHIPYTPYDTLTPIHVTTSTPLKNYNKTIEQPTTPKSQDFLTLSSSTELHYHNSIENLTHPRIPKLDTPIITDTPINTTKHSETQQNVSYSKTLDSITSTTPNQLHTENTTTQTTQKSNYFSTNTTLNVTKNISSFNKSNNFVTKGSNSVTMPTALYTTRNLTSSSTEESRTITKTALISTTENITSSSPPVTTNDSPTGDGNQFNKPSSIYTSQNVTSSSIQESRIITKTTPISPTENTTSSSTPLANHSTIGEGNHFTVITPIYTILNDTFSNIHEANNPTNEETIHLTSTTPINKALNVNNTTTVRASNSSKQETGHFTPIQLVTSNSPQESRISTTLASIITFNIASSRTQIASNSNNEEDSNFTTTTQIYTAVNDTPSITDVSNDSATSFSILESGTITTVVPTDNDSTPTLFNILECNNRSVTPTVTIPISGETVQFNGTSTQTATSFCTYGLNQIKSTPSLGITKSTQQATQKLNKITPTPFNVTQNKVSAIENVNSPSTQNLTPTSTISPINTIQIHDISNQTHKNIVNNFTVDNNTTTVTYEYIYNNANTDFSINTASQFNTPSETWTTVYTTTATTPNLHPSNKIIYNTTPPNNANNADQFTIAAAFVGSKTDDISQTDINSIPITLNETTDIPVDNFSQPIDQDQVNTTNSIPTTTPSPYAFVPPFADF